MARTLNRLTAAGVGSLGPGRHADGGGLYLDRDGQGRSRWVFLWKREGKRREMGLGAAGKPTDKNAVSLAKARLAADSARGVVKAGGDPIEARDAVPEAPVVVPTFGKIADDFVASMSAQWRNEKHRAQWSMTLKEYAAPLRPIPVDQIDTAAVLEVLQSIWMEKPETASRLRGRIERVLDAARAKGHRSGENPARWRGHLDHLLSKRQKLTRGHHAAMPYPEVAAFVAGLRKREAVAANALEFLILTAARSGEVLGATWGEIDLKAAVWTVPAARMKAGREHRVPLGARALEVLEAVKPLANPTPKGGLAAAHVFPGQARGAALSGMSLAMLMRRMKVTTTVHGFRSSFRDWVGEASTFPSDIAEAALAHTVGDATERAYRRGDALEKRRKMMEAWAGYVATKPKSPNVIPFAKAAS